MLTVFGSSSGQSMATSTISGSAVMVWYLYPLSGPAVDSVDGANRMRSRSRSSPSSVYGSPSSPPVLVVVLDAPEI